MPPSHPYSQPPSNRSPHHNRTTHAAFTNTVRNALDAPLPPTPPSPSLLSPSSSSSCSSSSNLPQFRNSGPLPHRGTTLPRPSTPNAYSTPLTPPSPYARSLSPGTSSPAISLIDDETQHREYNPPSGAFANARESPPSSHPLYQHPNPRTDGEVMTIRASPARTVTLSSHPAPSYLQASQSANFRRPSALPPAKTPTTPPTPSLPNDLENLYLALAIIPSLPSSSPRSHLSSIETMNDGIAVWATANPVVAMHIAALAGRFGVRGRYEGTLALGEAEEWMGRRGLVKRDGKGASFRERVRRMGGEGAAAGAVRTGSHRGRDLPLVVILLYSDVCGVDLMRMGDREARAMLADWATRFGPVSDEGMLGVMMEWGSDTVGKVDVDPRRSIKEDEGKVGRMIERIRALGEGDVRRGGSLAERLVGDARRSGSVRTSRR